MKVESTEIRFNSTKNIATAFGYVRFNRGKILIVADKLELFLGSHAITYVLLNWYVGRASA